MAASQRKVLGRTARHDAEKSPQRSCALQIASYANAGAQGRRLVVGDVSDFLRGIDTLT